MSNGEDKVARWLRIYHSTPDPEDEEYAIGQRVLSRLESYHPNPRSFLQHLAEIGGLISGSTVLQLLTGEYFDNSDLDIYVHEGQAQALVEYFKNLGYEASPTQAAYPYVKLKTLHGSETDEDSDNGMESAKRNLEEAFFKTKMESVTTLITEVEEGMDYASKKIDIIGTAQKDPLDFVATFHLTVTVNALVGKSIYVYYPELTLAHQNKILSLIPDRRAIKAIEKYEERGYELVPGRAERVYNVVGARKFPFRLPDFP